MYVMTAFQAFLLRVMNIRELAEGVWCSTGIFHEQIEKGWAPFCVRCRSKSNRLNLLPKNENLMIWRS